MPLLHEMDDTTLYLLASKMTPFRWANAGSLLPGSPCPVRACFPRVVVLDNDGKTLCLLASKLAPFRWLVVGAPPVPVALRWCPLATAGCSVSNRAGQSGGLCSTSTRTHRVTQYKDGPCFSTALLQVHRRPRPGD